ncbi:hypothetical protein L6164_028084 [Bauhinia variegata]|uniref:Uncharacterized protein n=1 Tax=Bauhinia variegata TaxID=167791 RepID=A0ACB9LWB4_BAUVA|nr:hypothetical protein L6164_028084 [Bauhinia variegata]
MIYQSKTYVPSLAPNPTPPLAQPKLALFGSRNRDSEVVGFGSRGLHLTQISRLGIILGEIRDYLSVFSAELD